MTSGQIINPEETNPTSILLQLTQLSKEMNDAIHEKDIHKIEQVHLKKQELINKLRILRSGEMETIFAERETLHDMIQSEWEKYMQAMADGKLFDEVKVIFKRIKELNTQIAEITAKIHEKLKIGN